MFKTLNEKVENFRRELGIIRLKILGPKNAVTEIKNSVDKFTHQTQIKRELYQKACQKKISRLKLGEIKRQKVKN